MLTAAQARAAANQLVPESLPGFSKVEKAISSAVMNQKFEVYLTGHIDSRLANYLTSIQYKVELTSDRNESITIIRW